MFYALILSRYASGAACSGLANPEQITKSPGIDNLIDCPTKYGS